MTGWLTDLVHAHRERLIRVVRKEGVTADDAVDCVHDAFESFLHLPQARPLADTPDDAVALLTVLARNVARNRRRRHHLARPHVEIDDDALAAEAPAVDRSIATAEQFAMAVGCVDTLGKLQRAVVRLRLLDEVPGQDVAAILDVTPGHVAVLLHRALANLRSCMISAGYTEA